MVVQHRSSSSVSSSTSASYLPITNTDTVFTTNNNIEYDESRDSVNSTMGTNNNSSNNNNTATVTVIKQNYYAICSFLIVYSIMAGYVAGTQPTHQFRYFSYHPLFMTCSMIGTMSIGTITKKIGGYMNTKIHGILSWVSLMMSGAGLYVIYRNKEINHFNHLKTYHAWTGLFVYINMIALGLVGGIVLHPDFGIAKTNGTIRKLHKFTSRFIISLSWLTAISGLYQLTQSITILAIYVVPLLFFVPLTLL